MSNKLSIISHVYHENSYITGCVLYPSRVKLSDQVDVDSGVVYGDDGKQCVGKSGLECYPLRQFTLNLYQVSFLFREIHQSSLYRKSFILRRIFIDQLLRKEYNVWLRKCHDEMDTLEEPFIIKVIIEIMSWTDFPIDFAGNYLILELVHIKINVEEGLSILSTLGGAFSALGERYEHYAIKAGETSLRQLRLACITGDPSLIARCLIFLVYSLCQRGLKQRARHLVRRFIHPLVSQLILKRICDNILRNMYKAACYRIKLP
ncbi:uncharacterized protein LOC141856405 [Brevipalpus obovatus]|uniref:uncharacterized protein LOC141856405 n=1 Tax=Brevipalpus obovatus TaxID=246614 RepID=UPI003D9E74D6